VTNLRFIPPYRQGDTVEVVASGCRGQITEVIETNHVTLYRVRFTNFETTHNSIALKPAPPNQDEL
jgi:hypothetical protein